MAADNKSLGKFNLDGIPPAPRGIPQIEVTFDIDANGILNVTALDKATNRSQHITITASSGLTESEIQKMKQDAEANAEADRKRKELVEVRNNADNTIYAAEKMLRENPDKVPGELKKEVEDSIASLRGIMNNDDPGSIRSATEALGQSIQKIGASMYQQPDAGAQQAPEGQQDQPGPDGGGETPPDGDAGDVVDGEFKSV